MVPNAVVVGILLFFTIIWSPLFILLLLVTEVQDKCDTLIILRNQINIVITSN